MAEPAIIAGDTQGAQSNSGSAEEFEPFDLVDPHPGASNSFTVVVKEVNVAPVLPSIGPQSVNELTLITTDSQRRLAITMRKH
jgi:hypothetical protein